jgi:release factor glutamine methyltransferase
MNIFETWQWSEVQLYPISNEAKREGQLLLAHILDCRPGDLPLYFNQDLTIEQKEVLAAMIAKRQTGYPLQYILGRHEFMSLPFFINEAALIPRQDTERIVEAAIACVKYLPAPLIADICTGSGAIAISLAHYLPKAQIIATDISAEALKLAEKNAALNQVGTQITFRQGDLFAPLGKISPRPEFDLIIANPPYISTAELDKPAKELSFEPRIALDGGEDGLGFYRRIAAGARRYLAKDGFLIWENGYDQEDASVDILTSAGWEICKKIYDYSDNYRGMVAHENHI